MLLTRTALVSGLAAGLSGALRPWRKPLAVHDPGKIVCDLAISLALGGDCLADAAVLRAEPAVYGRVASDPTISRLITTLAGDAPNVLKAIDAARAEARAQVWRLAGEHAPTHAVDVKQPLVIDVDATLVTAHSDREQANPQCRYGRAMAKRRPTREHWAIAGFVALVVVTAILVALAILKTRTPPAQAASPLPATSQTPGSPSPATLTTPTPATQTPPATPHAGLAGIGDILNAPAGASVLVIGDDSGDAADEWVSRWAREHLAQQATVSYHPWNRTAATYADAVTFGSGTRALTVWNASAGSPTMTTEPARAQQAWKDADVVLLSYGHGRAAKFIGPQLDAVLAAVRGRDATVPVAVLLQNPERAATEATQRDVTQAIKAWADAKGLPTVDIYGAFVADPAARNALVQSDGSPTPQGSKLWANTLAQAVSA